MQTFADLREPAGVAGFHRGRRVPHPRSLRKGGIAMNTSAVYHANNQLTQWGTTAMTYDANGNTLNDGTNTYAWDARNRLVSADYNGTSFSYDPLGRRVSKNIFAVNGIYLNTNYLYDGVNAVQEQSGGAVTANLLTGGVAGGPGGGRSEHNH